MYTLLVQWGKNQIIEFNIPVTGFMGKYLIQTNMSIEVYM